MQIPAQPPEIIPSEAVLIPPVIHRRYISGEDEQEGRQRTQLVNPHPLLQLHPFHNLGRAVSTSPSLEIDHHNSGVEVAGFPVREGEGERRVRPEGGSEVGREVGVAVLRRGQYGVVGERRGGELGDVVNED